LSDFNDDYFCDDYDDDKTHGVSQAAFSGFFPGSLLDPEDVGSMFLRNVGISPNYTALHL
jgi:hypothetical protein